jgi:hypothetical protein
MKKQLKRMIEQYEKSDTTLESYQAISSFVELVFQNDDFIEYTQDEGKRINLEKIKLNADKGDRSKKWNEYRDKKHKALHELDPHFPLQNLYHVYEYLKPENATYGIDFLYANTSPDEPMREQDKKEYLMFLNKTYKNILPFIKDEIVDAKNTTTKLKYKSFNEKSSILTIGEFEILIAKNSGNNNMHEVMSYLFVDNKDDLAKKFFYADIADERFKEEYNAKDKYAYKKYNNACVGINNKISKATNGQINDFLEPNTSKIGFVTINQKYL